MELPKYKCHKEVRAAKISLVEIKESGGAKLHLTPEGVGSIDVPPEYMIKHKPHINGYYVLYKDGYESFSPPQPFEHGYSLIK